MGGDRFHGNRIPLHPVGQNHRQGVVLGLGVSTVTGCFVLAVQGGFEAEVEGKVVD